MKDDLLAQMTRALADEHDGATAVPEATRARVIRTLAERKPRRNKWLLIGVPAFVVFGGSSAWAAATGRLPEVVEQAIAVITGSEKSEERAVVQAPPKSAHKGGSFSRGAATDSEGSPQPAPEEKAPAAEAPADQAESDKAVSSPKFAASPGAVDAKKDDATLAALSVYRAAHEAHFKEGNCDAAVRGYQKYLAQQPSGTFYLEAKYNLGVCLARLGRTQEARAALSPFAEGKFGDYRKAQSQELLEALGE